MPIVGVSITKKCTFRGADQEFSNVYYYSGPTPGVADADALAAAVKADEVQFHSGDVTFVRYRVWTAGGSMAANNMISQGTLSGLGSQAAIATMDRERAVLVSWPAGVSNTGKPVYLRKWFHSCGICAGVTFGTSQLQNTAQIATADRTAIATAAGSLVSQVVGGNTYALVAKSGRSMSGGAICHKYLEHHQLGDQWR